MESSNPFFFRDGEVAPPRATRRVALRLLPVQGRGELVQAIEEPAWRRDARCRAAELEEFFPNGRPPARLKALCAECPVRDACRETALESPWQPYGIWGGLTSTELMPEWQQRHEGASA